MHPSDTTISMVLNQFWPIFAPTLITLDFVSYHLRTYLHLQKYVIFHNKYEDVSLVNTCTLSFVRLMD